MVHSKYIFPHRLFIVRYLLKWTALATPVALITGSLVALFLTLLDSSTRYRLEHGRLLWLLPVAGIAIHFLYRIWGKHSEGGNNLIIDEIHEPGGGVPARMAPLVIITTIITHLFGGSAGREGTAVQAGGSTAALIGRYLKLTKEDSRILLMTGIAAGFGAVFGTPVTGAIFALEVPDIGRNRYNALLPCMMASLLAGVVAGAWGIHHTQYHILFRESGGSWLRFIRFDARLLLKVIVAGVAFGLAGNFFTALTHRIKHIAAHWIKPEWLIPVIGGGIIIGLAYALGTPDYLGLGVTAKEPGGISITSAFGAGGVTNLSWFWKLLFTAVTLGTGFKGGEVTPLFFIGAALGNVLAVFLGLPVDLLAGLGFIAVFAGAANTPLACTIMGVELFGGDHIIYYAAACFTAFYFSGRSGIYTARRAAAGGRRGYRRQREA